MLHSKQDLILSVCCQAMGYVSSLSELALKDLAMEVAVSMPQCTLDSFSPNQPSPPQLVFESNSTHYSTRYSTGCLLHLTAKYRLLHRQTPPAQTDTECHLRFCPQHSQATCSHRCNDCLVHKQEADPEEDDDEYGSETWLQENVESYAHELDTFEPPRITAASDAEGPGCRLVVNGTLENPQASMRCHSCCRVQELSG